jgi:hypothetical protein
MKQLINVCGRDIQLEGQLIRIGRLDADLYQFIHDPEPLLPGLRKCSKRIDLFTFMQRIGESTPKFNYIMEWDNLAVLPVSTYDHWWNQQIRSDPRNRARQAEKKGVTLREVPLDDALIQGIWEIYNECPVRQGRPFPHYGEDIETVGKGLATYLDSSIFIGAFLKERLIGFVKLVTDEARTQANLMHIVAMIKHRDKAPTNALIAHSVRACAERRIPYLVYQKFSYGKKGRDSLSHFKEINGFRPVELPRYYIPLTRRGWIGLRLGLHRPLIDHLPKSLFIRLSALRNSWYNRKNPMMTSVADT